MFTVGYFLTFTVNLWLTSLTRLRNLLSFEEVNNLTHILRRDF